MINVISMIMPVITMIMGFYFGYRIGKDHEIPEVEIKTPMEIVEEIKEKHEEKEFQDDLADYIDNIDNYPYNQKQIK